ncbi:unnamed protein product, partial [Prorocentrum cordatum]
ARGQHGPRAPAAPPLPPHMPLGPLPLRRRALPLLAALRACRAFPPVVHQLWSPAGQPRSEALRGAMAAWRAYQPDVESSGTTPRPPWCCTSSEARRPRWMPTPSSPRPRRRTSSCTRCWPSGAASSQTATCARCAPPGAGCTSWAPRERRCSWGSRRAARRSPGAPRPRAQGEPRGEVWIKIQDLQLRLQKENEELAAKADRLWASGAAVTAWQLQNGFTGHLRDASAGQLHLPLPQQARAGADSTAQAVAARAARPVAPRGGEPGRVTVVARFEEQMEFHRWGARTQLAVWAAASQPNSSVFRAAARSVLRSHQLRALAGDYMHMSTIQSTGPGLLTRVVEAKLAERGLSLESFRSISSD